MMIPALYDVARAYPHCVFHVLTSGLCARMFICRPDNVALHPTAEGALRLALRLLRGVPVDAVADMHNVLRSWELDAWCLLSGRRVAMLDKRRRERWRILHRRAATDRPFTLRYYDVFARLGMPCRPAFRGLFAGRLPQLPQGMAKPPGKRWVGIAPFARYRNKTYPEAMMREVVEHIVGESTDTEVLLFGSRGREADVLSAWADGHPRVHNVAGLLPLEQELAVMARLDVMLTMDSANMHLASLAGTRVVSLWGATTPACGFLGWGQSEADALVAGTACQPCTIAGSDSCRYGDYHCLTALRPESIARRVIGNSPQLNESTS